MNKILLPEYAIKDFVAKWGIIGVYLVIGMALVDTFLIPIVKRGIEFGKWLRKWKKIIMYHQAGMIGGILIYDIIQIKNMGWWKDEFV